MSEIQTAMTEYIDKEGIRQRTYHFDHSFITGHQWALKLIKRNINEHDISLYFVTTSKFRFRKEQWVLVKKFKKGTDPSKIK